ncbi:LysR family transcriptional regulator [Myxococcus sp. MxC21-1]|uniref:helix-turn-helix domain-containing protein n=1 Tax=Myxococcus sp. MxC21-1 TaxID=3041439 RepID=UPI002931F0A0|nr:LysR family transcriptional regulator [Myxococcus sp. MxC21-1]WNZ59033.1 LysR family transcriptional regulator [Myxococcus sp. MxC21-1]
MAVQKRSSILDWEDLRVFVALARAGSLSAAARMLKVSHATVGRRMAALEETLGRSLFDRRADGYVLTAEERPCWTWPRGWMSARSPSCAARARRSGSQARCG